MGFSQSVADEVLVRCRRHCCLCDEFVGHKIELHHIKAVADGGDDSIDNCIPLCFNCHAEVKSYDPRHPKGRKFTEAELKGHRDKCYAKYATYPEPHKGNNGTSNVLFEKNNTSKIIWGYEDQEKLCPIDLGMIIMIGGHAGSCKSMYTHHIITANIKCGAKIAYCCLKDNPNVVFNRIFSVATQTEIKGINYDLITAEEWVRIAECASEMGHGDLKLLTYEDLHNSSDGIISLVENSNANIIVIDDFNGLCLDGYEVERFVYSLKRAAIKSNAVVFVIYNLSVKYNRMDLRPMLKDFPSDGYYRICDIVQLLFRPSLYERYYSEDKHALEVIVAKGEHEIIQMEVHEEKSQILSIDTKAKY